MLELTTKYYKPFRGRHFAQIGFLWLILISFIAIFAVVIAPYDALEIDPISRLSPPSWEHWFGTDHFGRDTFSRSLLGSRMAIIIGLGSVAIALTSGTIIGVGSAYFPRVGAYLMRGVDVFMSFPTLLMALVLITILGRGVFNTVLVIGIVYMTTTARILYGLTLKLKQEVYVDAAIVTGASHLRIIIKHILPNLISPLLVQASFIFAFAQLQSASLDFLGLGLPPEIPSWGNMLSESRIYITRASWLLTFPGALIILTVFSMNIVGDVLRDAVDPRFKDDL